LFGWLYIGYSSGSDTIIMRITISGPFVGVIFRGYLSFATPAHVQFLC
jgi:hypothetical protein